MGSDVNTMFWRDSSDSYEKNSMKTGKIVWRQQNGSWGDKLSDLYKSSKPALKAQTKAAGVQKKRELQKS